MPPKKTIKKTVKKPTKPPATKRHAAATKTKPKPVPKSKQPPPPKKKTYRGKQQPPFKILVFSRTTAYRHASIAAGIRGLQRLADEISIKTRTPFTMEATEDATVFDRPRKLSTFKVIVLLSNSGDDCLNEGQLKNFENWVRKGGGVVGIHCATFACTGSTCSNGAGDEWYGNLLGGVFKDHPESQTARVRIVVEGPDSESDEEEEEDEFSLVKKMTTTKGKEKSKGRPFHQIHISAETSKDYLLKDWGKSADESDDIGKEKESEDRAGEEYITTSSGYKERTSFLWRRDEWYNFFSNPREKLNMSYKNGTTEDFTILLTVDESSYNGGKHGEDHPIAWCQQFPAPKTAEERKQERKDESMMNWMVKHHGESSRETARYLTEQEQKKKEEEKRKIRRVSEMGGRCFYTALGHFDEAYEDPWFMGHVLAGIWWAAKV